MLITRPEPGATETARRVAALGASLGFAPVRTPLQTVEPVPIRLPSPDRIAGIVLTSRNAIPALQAVWHRTPVWAVGDATARRAREAGFTRVVSADGDAVSLAALIADRAIPGVPANADTHDPDPRLGSSGSVPASRGRAPRPLTLLLATGSGVGAPIATLLRQRGFRVIRRIAYRTQAASALPRAAIQAIAEGPSLTILVFSAEAARILARLVAAAGLTEALRDHTAITISPSVTMALRHLPWGAVHTAGRPNQDEMLAMLR